MTRFQDFWAVNWQDGMLVSSEHMTRDQSYFENIAKRTLRTLMIDYGLAWDPAEPTPETSLTWAARMVDTHIVEVEVTSCRAVTQDGSYIGIYTIIMLGFIWRNMNRIVSRYSGKFKSKIRRKNRPAPNIVSLVMRWLFANPRWWMQMLLKSERSLSTREKCVRLTKFQRVSVCNATRSRCRLHGYLINN